MLSFPSNVRLYLATEPVDLRRSFDGLSALVDGTFGKQAMSGDLFVFMNRRGNQIRILFWDRDGYVIMMKRLEEGTFGAGPRRFRTLVRRLAKLRRSPSSRSQADRVIRIQSASHLRCASPTRFATTEKPVHRLDRQFSEHILLAIKDVCRIRGVVVLPIHQENAAGGGSSASLENASRRCMEPSRGGSIQKRHASAFDGAATFSLGKRDRPRSGTGRDRPP
jgi:hypothetical protein